MMPMGARQAFSFFKSKGYTDDQSAAIVGGLKQESATFDTKAVHDGGIGIGIAGWNKERRAELERFAKERASRSRTFGRSLNSPTTSCVHRRARPVQAARAAGNVEEGAVAFIGYERPSGYSADNPRGGHGYSNRLENAKAPGATLGQGGSGMPTGMDKQAAIRNVMAATEGDPDLRQASLSKLNGYYNQQDSMFAQDRAVLERDVKATNEALQFGQSVAIPEERIRSLLPADDAERVIGTLQRSQLQGQLYNAVKLADPGQISEMRQDLMTGTGSLSEMIRRTNLTATEAEQFTNRQDALQAYEAAAEEAR